MRVKLREIAAGVAADPKAAILDQLGSIEGYEVFHNLVLVATYIGPEKIGHIYVPDRKLSEDRFQGKVGLVLAVGPQAFQDDGGTKFGGVTVKVGDWVVYRPSDGIEHFVKDQRSVNDGVACRLFDDRNILGRVARPDMIF